MILIDLRLAFGGSLHYSFESYLKIKTLKRMYRLLE